MFFATVVVELQSYSPPLCFLCYVAAACLLFYCYDSRDGEKKAQGIILDIQCSKDPQKTITVL